ncbi:hypothetical protein DV451_003033 [Geotrichum candidum]|uniref:Ribosome-releasing factor 2, mitochondrial n=1 Tax=Geotrichum candidum TaxID=1173061 RepID=A0A9P5KTX3_GEOCN|nr:hypothetical protein DV451_003033 [Geotrichum candidum]KAF5108576.1 hypothetical protein DV453_002169 [Geotrichum candidum]
MDYLPAERDRGITITSAAITFNWANHKVNLIDTPGHADFTFEVIRSIRVLDGAVTILDGVAGVEAQTEKVWKQASEMEIPKIVFVNKMDRQGAGFSRTVREVVSKLNTQVAILNYPFFEGGKLDTPFRGVVDVLEKKIIQWEEGSDGKDVKIMDISEVDGVAEECEKARTALIETLSELDDDLVEHYLEVSDYMEVSSAEIKKALRKATFARKIVPVLCGASFRNIGVQPLLESIIEYLPAPTERPAPQAIAKGLTTKKGKKLISLPDQPVDIDINNKTLTTALAFKVVNDPKKGLMVYVRVYSGSLNSNSSVLNSTTGKKERVMKLFQMHADEAIEVQSVKAGNIGVLIGTKDIRTGDTIVSHGWKKDGIKSLTPVESKIQLNAIPVPPPVFFASIDPMSLSDVKGMEEALDILLKEDPSLHVTYDEDSGQTLLSGMGELHLEIARDRLINDLKAKVNVGKILVSYKETIQQPSLSVTKDSTISTTGDTPSSATVVLSVSPVFGPEEVKNAECINHDRIYVTYPENQEEHLLIPHHDIVHAIKVGIVPGVARGGRKAHYPLNNIHINVEKVDIPVDVSSPVAVSQAIRLAIEEALDQIPVEGYSIMEPIMNVRVIVSEEDIGTVVNDISSNRRGHIISLQDEEATDVESFSYKSLAEQIYTPPDLTMYMSKHGDRTRSAQSVVRANVPLQQMVGYLNYLRSLTKGRGTFLMDFDSYTSVPLDREQEILNEDNF